MKKSLKIFFIILVMFVACSPVFANITAGKDNSITAILSEPVAEILEAAKFIAICACILFSIIIIVKYVVQNAQQKPETLKGWFIALISAGAVWAVSGSILALFGVGTDVVDADGAIIVIDYLETLPIFSQSVSSVLTTLTSL